MEVYSISTSSMCLPQSLHLYQPLPAKGAAQWLYNHYMQPRAEESNCSVYNRDMR